MTAERLNTLQLLRAVAATLVFVFHLSDIFRTHGLVEGARGTVGAAGVDIFFVVSGFIITWTAGQGRGRFVLKRLARIVPLYWLVTLGVCAIGMLAPHLLTGTTITPEAVVKSLLFIPFARETGSMLPIVAVGWSLNYEMMFYALFALCLGADRCRTVLRVSAVLLLLVILGRSLDGLPPVAAFYTRGILLEFLAGMLICLAWRRDPALFRKLWPLLPLGIAALAAQEVYALPLYAPPLPREMAYGVPAACIVTGALSIRLPEGPWCRLATQVGDASYGIYLIHSYLLHLSARLLAAAGVTAPPWIILAGLVTYLATVMIARLLYRVVERPIAQGLDRRRAPPAISGQSRTS